MQLLETIRFQRGIFSNLALHQNRMNNSRKALFNCNDGIDLASKLTQFTSDLDSSRLYKCRVEYDISINKIEFIPYSLPIIKSLKLIISNDIEYSYKYLNRKQINLCFEQRGTTDDIIIVKNGILTDSSFANLLFYNGKQWVTPASPLLNGIQRAKLINYEQIVTAQIRPDDLHNFSKIRLINAMLRFEDEVDVLVVNIY